MLDIFITRKDAAATPVWLVRSGETENWCETHAGPGAAWVTTSGFSADGRQVLLLPDGSGGLAGVLLGVGDGSDPFVAGALPTVLPMGDFRLAGEKHGDVAKAALGYALGTYRFTRYSGTPREWPRLVLPESVDGEEVKPACACRLSGARPHQHARRRHEPGRSRRSGREGSGSA